jgi:cyclic lactone autoinducer peptide
MLYNLISLILEWIARSGVATNSWLIFHEPKLPAERANHDE